MQSSDLRQTINKTIIDALESGNLPPWRRPWRCSKNAGTPANVVSKTNYSGVNPLLLEIAAQRHNFLSRHWGTFNQWKELGGNVMRRPENVSPGKWGTTIVFCRPIKKAETASDGEETDSKFWLLRSYTVFNIDQVEGDHLDHLRVSKDSLDESDEQERFDEAERIIGATNADIRFGGDRAFYSPAGDFIQMPPRSQFVLPEFYQTLCHEMVHWTEAPYRLNWDRKKPENDYGRGEMIAELGGCYLASEMGLPTADNLTNHASYLLGWITSMKSDPKFIFKAASQASKAVDFILSFSKSPDEVEQPAEELALV